MKDCCLSPFSNLFFVNSRNVEISDMFALQQRALAFSVRNLSTSSKFAIAGRISNTAQEDLDKLVKIVKHQIFNFTTFKYF